MPAAAFVGAVALALSDEASLLQIGKHVKHSAVIGTSITTNVSSVSFKHVGRGLCQSVDGWFLEVGYAMPKGTCPSLQVCKQKCEGDDFCGAVNWRGNGDCLTFGWMQDKPYEQVFPDLNSEYDCYAKSLPNLTRSNVEQGKTLPGFIHVGNGLCESDDGQLSQPSPSYLASVGWGPLSPKACQQRCVDDEFCAAINYFNEECLLFGTVANASYTKANPTVNPQHGCWIKWASTKARRTAIPGFKGVGEGMCVSGAKQFFQGIANGNYSYSSREDCMLACRADATCGAVGWSDTGACIWFQTMEGKPYDQVKPDQDTLLYCFVKVVQSTISNISGDTLEGFRWIGKGRCQSANRTFRYLADYEFRSPGAIVNSANARTCQQACAQEDACAAINIDNGKCTFFRVLPDSPYTGVQYMASSDSECYAKAPATMSARRAAYKGFRYRGRGTCVADDSWYIDLGNVIPVGECLTAQCCQAKCSENEQCGAVTFGGYYREHWGCCWFHGAMEGKAYTNVRPDFYPKLACFAKLKPTENRTKHMTTLPAFKSVGPGLCESDKGRFLGPKFVMMTPGALACQQACYDDQSCGAINYARNGSCLFYGKMYDNYTKADSSRNVQYDCYVKWAPLVLGLYMPARRSAITGFEGVGLGRCATDDGDGATYAGPQVPNADVCMQKCGEDDSCGAINWWDDRADCLFFAAIDGKRYKKVRVDSNPQYYCWIKLAPGEGGPR